MKKPDGFTAVELLVVMMLSLLILGGVCNTLISQSRAYMAQEQIVEANQSLRTAMDVLSQEIRLAGYKTASQTFTGIVEATEKRIRIQADLDQDGTLSGAGEDVTYSYDPDSQRLYRGPDILGDKISSFSFAYTMEDGTETSAPADLGGIRKVKISVTARTNLDLTTKNYRGLRLFSEVTPRNLGL
jgi:type II secretory pathway pseudopilin PulG